MNLPIDESARLWTALFEQAEVMLKSFAGNRWRFTPNLDVSRELAEEEWMAFNFPNRYESKSLCEELLRSGKISSCDKEEIFRVQCRVWMAYHFIGKMTFAKDGRIIAICPPPTESDFLIKLLTDWWEGIGQFWAFEQLYEGKLLQDLL